MLIKPKGSPFYIFRHLRHFLKEKIQKFQVFCLKYFAILSLRYSADFRRSRLVVIAELPPNSHIGLHHEIVKTGCINSRIFDISVHGKLGTDV